MEVSEFHWIGKPWKEDRVWLIRYGAGNFNGVTQGRDKYNAYEMAADAICTSLGIRANWYRRLIYKIFKV